MYRCLKINNKKLMLWLLSLTVLLLLSLSANKGQQLLFGILLSLDNTGTIKLLIPACGRTDFLLGIMM